MNTLITILLATSMSLNQISDIEFYSRICSVRSQTKTEIDEQTQKDNIRKIQFYNEQQEVVWKQIQEESKNELKLKHDTELQNIQNAQQKAIEAIEYSIDNDSTTKDSQNEAVTVIDIPSSYTLGADLPYYDIEVPYQLTCKEVGGLAIECEANVEGYKYDSSYQCPYGTYADTYVGCKILTQNEHITGNLAEKSYNEETKNPVYTKFGTEMYAITLPKGFMPDFMELAGFSTWSNLSQKGVLCDLILTDNTVIHCAVCDGISTVHSNGIPKIDGWTASSSQAGGGARYRLNKLNYPEYENFFHAASCHTVEFFGSGKNFMDFYNIKPDGTANAIKYIRIYKGNLSDPGIKVKEEFKNLYTKL